MRRSTTKYLLSAGLLTFGSFILTASCAKNDSSMFVVGVIDVSATTCTAKADTTDALLAGGALDTAFTQSYTAFLLVGNQLTQQGSREQLRTETSRVSLRGAEVTLTDVGGVELAGGHYSTVGTGFGKLHIDSNLPNAELYVDDKFVGNAPSVLTLSAGSHHVVVKADSYQSWDRSVEVMKDSESNIHSNLAPIQKMQDTTAPTK